MRKVIAAMYVSLDGVVEDPAWTGPFWNHELAEAQRDLLFSSDALLLGRVTYEGFAAAWPTMTDEEGFADRMNSLPKFVATRTLDELSWNATAIKGDVVTEVALLKQQPGDNILLYGSAGVVNTLTPPALIDEYRLMVFPVTLGGGKRLFADDGQLRNFKLAESKTAGDALILRYRKA